MLRFEVTKARILLFRDRFVCREDRYGLQFCREGEVGYSAVKGRITDELIADHLRGKVTPGGYCALPGKTKWLAFDFDALDLKPVLRLKHVLKDVGAEGYIELSGCKGWHLWVFLAGLEPNSKARMAGQAVLTMAGLEGAEVFPKQDAVSAENPGNLIKLPLGVHKATGKRCLFVNQAGQPLPDQFRMLEEVAPACLEDLARKLRITGERRVLPNQTDTPRIVKPCLLRLIEQGVEKGYRNEAGFVIASEMRRVRASKATAGGVLAAWNLRCQPPLLKPELKVILDSAYASEAKYEHGCRWRGVLSEVMKEFCVGKRRCLYLDLLFQMNAKNDTCLEVDRQIAQHRNPQSGLVKTKTKRR